MSAGLESDLLKSNEREAYSQLLSTDGGNLVYASQVYLEFLRAVIAAQADVLVVRRKGRIVGGLPFAVLGRPELGAVLGCLPWWGSRSSIVPD
jgi:hypothetical protein